MTLNGTIESIEDQARAQADIAALAGRYHDARTAEDTLRGVFAPQDRITPLLHPDHVDVHGFDGEG